MFFVSLLQVSELNNNTFSNTKSTYNSKPSVSIAQREQESHDRRRVFFLGEGEGWHRGGRNRYRMSEYELRLVS